MLKIRPDQMEAVARGVAQTAYSELLSELRAEHPDRADLPEYLPEIVDIASMLGFSGRDEVKGLAQLMLRDPDELSGTFWSEFLQPVLLDTNRSGTARLYFINRYIIPRILRDRAEGRSGPPPLPEETNA